MMTKKLILLIIAMVSVTISSFAQEGASVFKNYKYRFQKYRLLTTSFGTGNNTIMSDNIQQSSSSSNSASSFHLNGSLLFNQIINSQKLQQITYFNLGLSYGSDRSSSSFATYSNGNSGSFSINLNQQNRFYKNNHFFELNYGITNREQYNNSKANQLAKISNGIGVNAAINIGAGNGRLEMVGDVAQALFILTDFKNRGIITNYTNDDATALAKQITRIYNTRIIDFRYRLRGQLGMLDSFFSASGLINGGKSQSTYFISLFDNWLNNNYVQRFCGSRFSYGISYGNQYQNDYTYRAIPAFNYLSTRIINNYYTPGLYFNYTKEIPISLHWQKSFSIYLYGAKNYSKNYSYRIDTNTVSTNKNNFTNINSLLELSYKLSWYPNSRTNLNARISSSILYNPSDVKTWKSSPVSLYIAPSANLFYFISPKVNFNITIAPICYFTHQFVKNTSNINTQIPAFNAGLNYYIY